MTLWPYLPPNTLHSFLESAVLFALTRKVVGSHQCLRWSGGGFGSLEIQGSGDEHSTEDAQRSGDEVRWTGIYDCVGWRETLGKDLPHGISWSRWPHMWNPSSHLQFHHACVLLAHEVMKSWVVASLPPTQTCSTVIPKHPHKTSLQYLERSWSKNKTSWKHHGSFARLGNSRDPETGELNASFTASAQLSTSSLWCVGKVLCGEVLHLKDDFLWIPCDYTVRSPT